MENKTNRRDYIKSHRSNKQHADKIIQKILLIDENQAKRAIWELVQNAIDLAIKDEINITIKLTDDYIEFIHDGKCFNYDSLYSLLIQVSSKDDSNNENEIGQYGTGFCSTHAFGRKIILNGTLQDENQYAEIKDFTIDRNGKSAELTNKIIEQIKQLDIIDNSNNKCDSISNKYTSFKYEFACPLDKKYASIAIKYIKVYIHHVLALNNSLKSFSVNIETKDNSDDIKTTTYKVDNETELKYLFNGLYHYRIHIKENNQDHHKNILLIDCNEINAELKNEDITNSKIILPLQFDGDKFTGIKIEPDFARVFLYFPLIGSEKTWGTNFILHSPKFKVTTERDGLHIETEAKEATEYNEINKTIIENATNVIFDFLDKHASSIINPYSIAELFFSEDKTGNNFFSTQTKKWIDFLKSLPIINIQGNDNKLSIDDCHFPDEGLLEKPSYITTISKVINRFWRDVPIDVDSEFVKWTEILKNWDRANNSAVKWISIEDIAKKISEEDSIESIIGEENIIDKGSILEFYKYIYEVDEKIFQNMQLLPNLKGKLTLRSALYKNTNIDNYLIGIANELDLETSTKIIDPSFIFDYDFEEYTGKMLHLELSNQITFFKQDKSSFKLHHLEALIKLCSIFTIDHNNTTRYPIMQSLSKLWEVNFEEKQIQSFDEENRLRFDDTYLPFLVEKSLEKLYEQDKSWNTSNEDLIVDIVTNVYKLAKTRAILKSHSKFLTKNHEYQDDGDLYYETEENKISPELIELYNEIFSIESENTAIDINDKLLNNKIYNSLQNLIDHEKTEQAKFSFENKDKQYDNRILANKIYALFCKEQQDSNASSILTAKYKKIILKIINSFSEQKEREELFRPLSEAKADLFFESASGREKNVIFKMMQLEDAKKDRLVEVLSDDNNFKVINKLIENQANLDFMSKNIDGISDIIVDAKATLLQKERDKNHVAHIKQIGDYIETKILTALKSEDYELYDKKKLILIKEEQDGQDYIIKKNGKSIYYIEVKSRWSTSYAVRLSKNQTLKAHLNPRCYSVITVDLSRREIKDNYEPTFESFKNDIRVMNNVGDNIQSVKDPDNVVDAKDIIPISDYSSTIDQDQFKKGSSWDDFIIHLKNHLESA